MDPVLGAIILAILGGIGWAVKWIAGRIPPRIDPQAQIAALAEQQKLAQSQHDLEMGAMAAKVEEVERRQRVLEDYAEQLRFHISTGKPPPPPAWPVELHREAR